MAMVMDPICGMRIDPDDAVATAEHDGQRYWFCSEACRAAFVADPDPASDRLTEAELAGRSGTTPDRIRELVEFGILGPDEDGTFPRRDVMRARVVAYLQGMGIGAADLGRALQSGHLTLGYLEAAGRQHPRSAMTHEEVAEQIGLAFETLARVYVAFGLRAPQRGERVREEDLAVLDILCVLIEAGVGGADVLRMARVWGDSTRRIAQYLPHYFHEAVEQSFRQRGLDDNPAYEAAIREVGMRIGRSGEDLLGWLFRRHSEVFMTAHQLDHVEAASARSRARDSPCRSLVPSSSKECPSR
jgi:YHS domain-containing protein